MKSFTRLPFLLVLLLLSFTACNKDDEPEPEPKPQSYIEFGGRVYELNTAYYVSQNPPNEKQLLMEFYSMNTEELQAMSDPQSGQFMNGQILSFGISSPEAGVIEEGNYTFILNDMAEFSIYKADLIIEYSSLKNAGIFLYPSSGTINFETHEEGHLVTFDFTLTNGDQVTGQYLGELIKSN